jgi:hypothetical protein
MNKGNPTAATKATRINPNCFSTFLLIGFSMGVVRFALGIIEESGGWQDFFSLFSSFFERSKGGNCPPVFAFYRIWHILPRKK